MTVSMESLVNCFFDPATGRAIDAVHPVTGNGVWGGKTPEQMREEYPGIEVITFEAASDRQEAAARTEPTETTEERFWYYLEVLPPMRWARHHSSESFCMVERTTGRITHQLVRLGRAEGARYFEFEDLCTLTHEERCARVLAKFPELAR